LEISSELHAPVALPPGKEQPIITVLDDREKRKYFFLPRLEPDFSVIKPVACRCTDCALPALGKD
jgi:hypothetical protein